MIVIIGAGISGLSLAYYLQKRGKAYLLLEKSSRVGGVIQTKLKDNTVFDLGPNSLLVDEHVQELINELELSEDVIEAAPVAKNRFLIHEGEIRKLPDKPQKILTGSLLSFRSKIKIFRELLNNYPKATEQDESVASFFKRHFGQEVVDKFVFAFVNGIYSTPPETLSIRAAFPKLVALEKKYGSVLRGLMKGGSLERMKTVNFRKGLSQLPKTISNKLKFLELGASISSIKYKDSNFIVSYHQGEIRKTVKAEKLVSCIGARATANLFADLIDENSLAVLNRVNYTSVSSTTVLTTSNVQQRIPGFGALGTRASKFDALGVIAAHQVFPYKVKEGASLFTVMQKEHQQTDPKLVLENLFGRSISVQHTETKDWRRALPVYDHSILNCTAVIKALEEKQLYINANWFGGVSVKDCISKSKEKSTLL